jgi:hypothetical protein
MNMNMHPNELELPCKSIYISFQQDNAALVVQINQYHTSSTSAIVLPIWITFMNDVKQVEE